MSESTATCCFSQPSPPSIQGDPIHALSSSVSFGRYVSESLAWEKWSAFTNNRYKEEAQRYSKPGSVAQMKAYFEAHYKKKAADRAAALNSENQNISAMDQNLVLNDEIGVSIEVGSFTPCEKKKRAKDLQILDDEYSILADPVASNQQNLVKDLQLCKSTPHSEQKGLEDITNVKVDGAQFADCVDAQNPVRDVENLEIDASNPQNKMSINVPVKLEDPESLDKDKVALCSNKLRSRTGVPKPPVPPKKSVSLHNSKHNGANQYRKATTAVPKPPVPPEPPVSLQKRKHNHASIDREGTVGVRNPPVPPKPSTSLQKRMHNNADPDREGTAGASKPPVPQKPPVSLQKRKHNNANLDLKGKTVQMPDKKRITSYASQVSQGKPVKDSVVISQDGATTFQERKVRHRSPLHQSVSNGGKEEAKSQSEFVGESKSPGACGREERPPIVTRAIIFKSEERAAKRKEFFKRLQQQAKVNTTEKGKLQEQTKVKAINYPKPKSGTSKTSRNEMQKVSAALPCSPTLGRKMPLKLQDNSSQPPRHTITLPCSAGASTRTPSKLQDNNSRSPWKNSTLVCSSSASTTTPSKVQDNKSRSPWRHSTLACSSIADVKTPSKPQDSNSRTPWKYSTVACSSNVGTKTPSKLKENNSRSPWRQSTLACSSSAGTHTPSKLQDNIARPPSNTTLPYSSGADRKTPSKLQDNNLRSPWRHTTLASSPCVDKKTPSRVQVNNPRPPRRLTAKSNYKETIEKNNRSPFNPARSRSKKSTHENSSPNIQPSCES